jgi:hypothetical protein
MDLGQVILRKKFSFYDFCFSLIVEPFPDIFSQPHLSYSYPHRALLSIPLPHSASGTVPNCFIGTGYPHRYFWEGEKYSGTYIVIGKKAPRSSKEILAEVIWGENMEREKREM